MAYLLFCAYSVSWKLISRQLSRIHVNCDGMASTLWLYSTTLVEAHIRTDSRKPSIVVEKSDYSHRTAEDKLCDKRRVFLRHRTSRHSRVDLMPSGFNLNRLPDVLSLAKTYCGKSQLSNQPHLTTWGFSDALHTNSPQKFHPRAGHMQIG